MRLSVYFVDELFVVIIFIMDSHTQIVKTIHTHQGCRQVFLVWGCYISFGCLAAFPAESAAPSILREVSGGAFP